MQMDKGSKSDRKRLTLWQLREELSSRQDVSELLADFLLSADDFELWRLQRWSVLALRSKAKARSLEAAPFVKALDLLYCLTRFLETFERYPSRSEQSRLLEADLHKSMSVLLNDESRGVKARSSRRKQRESKLRKTVGIDLE